MPVSDQGSLKGRYQLFPRTLIFLTRGDQVLLIKGAPDKRLWANQYNGIGGHVEAGEDVLSAARRELGEESGLTAENLRLCAVITIDTGQPAGIGIYVLRGEYRSGEPRASAEGQLEWAPRARIESLPIVEDLPVLLPRVLEMGSGDPVIFAQYAYNQDGELVITFAPE